MKRTKDLSSRRKKKKYSSSFSFLARAAVAARALAANLSKAKFGRLLSSRQEEADKYIKISI